MSFPMILERKFPESEYYFFKTTEMVGLYISGGENHKLNSIIVLSYIDVKPKIINMARKAIEIS